MSCALKDGCKSLNQTLHFGDWHQNAALAEFPGLFRAAFPPKLWDRSCCYSVFYFSAWEGSRPLCMPAVTVARLRPERCRHLPVWLGVSPTASSSAWGPRAPCLLLCHCWLCPISSSREAFFLVNISAVFSGGECWFTELRLLAHSHETNIKAFPTALLFCLSIQ